MLSHFLLATLTKMTIAYHGKIKNFSSLAIADFNEVANIDKEMLPVKTYEELLKSENKYCFLAVQNSNHTLSQIYKMIMEYHWNVVGEYYWNTPLSLVGTGTEERKIKHVVVVGHIAGVCREYLDNKKLHIINVEDTAEACEYLKNTPDEAYAAIVPRVTALHYNLNILSSRVDDPDTLTRFFLVSKSNTKLNGSQPFKTTLVVRLPNRTGILHKTVGCFATREVNICQIESFPTTKANSAFSPFEHIFCIDIEGSIQEVRVSRALENLKEFCTELTVLGSYPVYVHDQPLAMIGL